MADASEFGLTLVSLASDPSKGGDGFYFSVAQYLAHSSSSGGGGDSNGNNRRKAHVYRACDNKCSVPQCLSGTLLRALHI